MREERVSQKTSNSPCRNRTFQRHSGGARACTFYKARENNAAELKEKEPEKYFRESFFRNFKKRTKFMMKKSLLLLSAVSGKRSNLKMRNLSNLIKIIKRFKFCFSESDRVE